MIADLNCQRYERAEAIKAQIVAGKSILGIEYVDLVDETPKKKLRVYLFSDSRSDLKASNFELIVESEPDVKFELKCDKATEYYEITLEEPHESRNDRERYQTELERGHYRLTIKSAHSPVEDLDPVTSSYEFVVGESSHFLPEDSCFSSAVSHVTSGASAVSSDDPDIPYIAKDYESFRRLLLNRLSTIMPDWQERTAADIGMVMVEVMAAVGDKLSYFQDAIATEAYLGTARQRKSVRRHLRLLDLKIHEGCSARGFVFVNCQADRNIAANSLYFLTELYRENRSTELRSSYSESSLNSSQLKGVEQFEPVDFSEPLKPETDTLLFRRQHNKLYFYTWDAKRCILNKGATTATLWTGNASTVASTQLGCSVYSGSTDEQPSIELREGDFLLIEEVKGPNTDNPSDADQDKKQIVRLTNVEKTEDIVYSQPVWNIEWHPDDALRQDFCISNRLGPNIKVNDEDKSCCDIRDISVARGNIVAVEHRQTHELKRLGETASPVFTQVDCDSEFELAELNETSEDFERQLGFSNEAPDSLRYRNLSHSKPILDSVSTTEFIATDPHDALPSIVLYAMPAVMEGDISIFLQPTHLESADKFFEFLDTDFNLDLRRKIQDLLPPALALMISQANRSHEIAKHPDRSTILGKLSFQDIRKIKGARYLRDHIWRLVVENTRWIPVDSLLRSGPDNRHFVVEMDDLRRATIRFGDGTNGAKPLGDTHFFATFQTANLVKGNVGEKLIQHVIFSRSVSGFQVSEVRNPLPLTGGKAPEDVKEIQQNGPASRIRRQSAVIAKDYREIVMRDFAKEVQSASASIRSLGAFSLVTMVVDPFLKFRGSVAIGGLKNTIKQHMDRFRQMGHVLKVEQGVSVPVNLSMEIIARKGVSASDVREAVELALGSEALPDGSLGFFHPDRLTFGNGIYGTQITELVNAISGVANSAITLLQKVNEPDSKTRALYFGPLEIATKGCICLDIGESP